MIINQYARKTNYERGACNSRYGPETLFSICIPYRGEYVGNFLILRLLQGILGFGTVRNQDDHHHLL